MVDLKSDENTFRIHPEDEPKYNRPEITGIGLMEQIEDKYKINAPTKESLLNQIEDYENSLNAFKEYNQSRENYIQLMDTFLNRKQKRKLSRYKGFKSFTDRIYGK